MEVIKYNQERAKKINEFMECLIAANNTEEKVNLYNEYLDEIKNITPIDIFYLNHYSDNSNLSIEDIKKTANKFINVFHKGLEKCVKDYDHILLKSLVLENNKIEEHLNGLKTYYKSKDLATNKKALLNGLNECFAFEKKFVKYENIIFPSLESKLPSNKPFEVLWELHDDARSLLKSIINNLKKDNIDESIIIKQIGEYYFLIYGINQKEELIILPLLNQFISNDKLNSLYNECLNYQFVFLGERKLMNEKTEMDHSKKFFKTKTGELTFKQLDLVLNNLPIDITFVDNTDVVRYYNNRFERHFPRNPSVIGRLVKHCHPPKSIKAVEKIISDFRNDKRDFAEFWINIKGTFLYIIYYAIKDEKNHYQGVLEVSQDITKLRELSGEKRINSSE